LLEVMAGSGTSQPAIHGLSDIGRSRFAGWITAAKPAGKLQILFDLFERQRN